MGGVNGRQKMLAVTVRLPESVHAALTEAARYNGLSLNAYIREAAFVRLTWTHALAAGRLQVGDAGEPYIYEYVEKAVHQVLYEWLVNEESDSP